jgi:hypothetical protein
VSYLKYTKPTSHINVSDPMNESIGIASLRLMAKGFAVEICFNSAASAARRAV